MEQRLTEADEENVATLITYSDEHIGTIRERVSPDLFTRESLNLIVQKAYAFYDEFHSAPGPHIKDLLERWLNRPKEGEKLLRILADMEQLAPHINAAFVLKGLDKFIAEQRLAVAAIAMQKALEHHNLEEAQFLVSEAAAASAGRAVRQVYDPFADPLPPKFDVRMLPQGKLRRFVADRAKSMGVDAGGLAWAALSACSGALDGSTRLQIKRYYEMPPGIWVLLLGPPSSGRTPILNAAFKPIRAIQNEDTKQYQKDKADWDAADKNTRGDEPIRRRLITDNATVEAMQKIEARQARGLILFQDEWASLIGNLDKYNAGKGAYSDRSYILRGFDGGPYALDRLSGDRHTSNHHFVIVGGIQPDRLRELGKLDSDGLLQRHPPFWLAPMVKDEDDDDEPEGSEVVGYENLIQHLVGLDGNRILKLDQAAYRIRKDVVSKARDLSNDSDLGGAYASFCGKLERVWASTALVVQHVLDLERSVPETVRQEAAEIARTLVFDNMLKHAVRFYSWYNSSGDDTLPKLVCGWLLSRRVARIVTSDVTSNVHQCRGMNVEQLRKVLSYLVAWGWLTPETEVNPRAWRVNQVIYSQFAARAADEIRRRERTRALLLEAVGRRSSDQEPTDNEQATFGSYFPEDPACGCEEKEFRTSSSSPHAPKQEPQEIMAKGSNQRSPASDQKGSSSPASRFVYRRRTPDEIERRMHQTEEEV